MEASLDIANDTTGDDTLTRHSSKLSLGSSPSILSGDEEDGDNDEGLEGDPHGNDTGNDNNGNDHHTAKPSASGMGDQKESETDDDNLFDGSLPPPSASDLDDINMEHDSASPLSSVPDDFPLSPETQDDSLLLLSPPPPATHTTAPMPPTPSSPMTRRQKQQLQAATIPASLPREPGFGSKRTSGQVDTTLSSNNSNKRKRRSRNQGGQYQASSERTQLSTTSDSGDKTKEHGSLIENDSVQQQDMKSKRVSIHGRNIHNKSTTGGTNTDDDDDDDDDDDGNDMDEEELEHNKVDETTNSSNKHTPLGSTKHHNNSSTKAPTPLPKSNTATQQHSSKDGDNGQQDTDSNNEEKENTPVISNQDYNGTSLRNDFSGTNDNTAHTSTFDDSKNQPTNEEERDDQQQHKEAYDALTRIEVEFARLRDKLYHEKMAELNEEALMIANGTHPNLVTLMAEIEEKKGRRISTAEAWRKYQHANFKRQFEGFEYQANVHFISRKSSMRRKILAETNGKRWRLEDELGKLNDPSQKHGKLIPDTNTLTIRKQGQREKTMDLQDIKDAIGFPRAPQVAGLSSQDIRDDLLLLGLGTSRSH